jgi:hypothetical protein
VSGFHLAFLIGAALVVAALVVGLTVLQGDGKPQPVEEEVGRDAEPAYSEGC